MFFDTLQAVCDEKGVSVSALLDSIGMSRGNINRWRTGLVPKPATIIKLADALGVDRERLMPINEKKPTPEDGSGLTEKTDISDDDIKFALFGGGPVTDEQFAEVKQFVRFIKERDANGGKR